MDSKPLEQYVLPFQNPRLIILSSQADKRFVEEAKKIGVRAHVAKTKAGEALVKAVEAAIKGEDFVVLD